MISVKANGITVEVYPETIRARMHKSALLVTAVSVIDEMAEETGITEQLLNIGLVDLVNISPRVKVVEGELDFGFALHSDTPEVFKTKFYGYLDCNFHALLVDIQKAIETLDRVQDVDLLPGLVFDEKDKKK